MSEENGTMNTLVRGIGLVVLVLGLVLALITIREAWLLYHQPARVERFAVAIETGSNIDHSLSSLRESVAADAPAGNDEPAAATPGSEAAAAPDNIRVSYFLAWVIVLLLLLLLARIALSAIKTGGELALYDTHIRQFARQLLKETGAGGQRNR